MTYQDIIDIIKRTGESPEHLWTLGKWLERYGMEFWNGKCFDTEKDFNGRNLYPICEWHEEYDSFCVMDYELR